MSCDKRCYDGTFIDEYTASDGRLVAEYCECDDCYTGAECEKECDDHGRCLTNSNGTRYCDCDDIYEGDSYTGDRCQTETCPHTIQGKCVYVDTHVSKRVRNRNI